MNPPIDRSRSMLTTIAFILAVSPGLAADKPPAASSEAPRPAQERLQDDGGPPRPRQGIPGDDLRETITLLMMVRMKNDLDLSKQQYEQIVPKVEQREKERQASVIERRTQSFRVRDLLSREGVKDAELMEAVEKMIALEDTER